MEQKNLKKMSKLLKKFKNKLTLKGKKLKSTQIINNSIKLLQKNHKKNHKKIIQVSLIQLAPLFSVKSVKKTKKKSKEFPFFLNPKLRILLSIKLILSKLKSVKTTNTSKQLSNEIVLVLKKNSYVLTQKNQKSSYAFFQKKFANYRWF